MSPVDEKTHKMIMDEFAKIKNKLIVLEKSRLEKKFMIQGKEQQQTSKKLKLLSLTEQRMLEQEEQDYCGKKKREEERKKRGEL